LPCGQGGEFWGLGMFWLRQHLSNHKDTEPAQRRLDKRLNGFDALTNTSLAALMSRGSTSVVIYCRHKFH